MGLVAYISFLQPLSLSLFSSLHKRGYLLPLLNLANAETLGRKTKARALLIILADIF